MGAEFRNIELEVRASADLSSLGKALGKRFLVNYCGKVSRGEYLLSGAFDHPLRASPEYIALGLCKLIQKLKGGAKRLWINADDRVFDIGLDATRRGDVGLELFGTSTLNQIAKIEARLAVSVYPWDLKTNVKTARRRAANKRSELRKGQKMQ